MQKCASNIHFSVVQVDRDTQKCAYKCSYVCVAGESREVYKDPVTDPGKTSKRGRLQLHRKQSSYVTLQHCQAAHDDVSHMMT